ncbi:Ecdysone receptor [Quillaja saponaria]|uniref:Ecdysone receptor n=1 Tax=Quillaja saponaria TaxID=32244 RepID=A0AAD7KXS3_QUISA|nr:Ecdysone receptor [Quillaja saponaria]
MKISMKVCLLHPLLIINFFLSNSVAQLTHPNYCGKKQILASPLNANSTELSSLLKIMTLCKSQKLYFRTSLGLLQVSSIDSNTKTFTISHSSCSSSLHYVSPSLIGAGFPSPPQHNSLLLFNCSSRKYHVSQFIQNCTRVHTCGAAASSSTKIQNQEKVPHSCLLVNDLEKLNMGFHPKDLNCSHYSFVYRSSNSDADDFEEYKLGMVISFNIPDHVPVPDICKECEKPNGNCGFGLRCICHPIECKGKVISMCGSVNPFEDSMNRPHPVQQSALFSNLPRVAFELALHLARKVALPSPHFPVLDSMPSRSLLKSPAERE